MQFSEAEGYSHLYLVPSMPDQPEHARGPRLFTYLVDDQARWLPATQREAIALSVRAEVA